MAIIGLDPAQSSDWAGIVGVVAAGSRPAGPRPRWRLVACERAPRHTPYRALATHVATAARAYHATGRAVATVIDATGVGRPVTEMVRDHDPPGPVVGVTITAGRVTGERHCRIGGTWPDLTVPKPLLVEHLQAAVETDALILTQHLPHTDTLRRELHAFRAAPRATVEQPGRPPRLEASGGEHDDLVLALALAVWLGDHLADRAHDR